MTDMVYEIHRYIFTGITEYCDLTIDDINSEIELEPILKANLRQLAHIIAYGFRPTKTEMSHDDVKFVFQNGFSHFKTPHDMVIFVIRSSGI